MPPSFDTFFGNATKRKAAPALHNYQRRLAGGGHDS